MTSPQPPSQIATKLVAHLVQAYSIGSVYPNVDGSGGTAFDPAQMDDIARTIDQGLRPEVQAYAQMLRTELQAMMDEIGTSIDEALDQASLEAARWCHRRSMGQQERWPDRPDGSLDAYREDIRDALRDAFSPLLSDLKTPSTDAQTSSSQTQPPQS